MIPLRTQFEKKATTILWVSPPNNKTSQLVSVFLRVRLKILIFHIRVLNLLWGSASKSNFWQCVHCISLRYTRNINWFWKKTRCKLTITIRFGSLIIETTLVLKTAWGVHYLGRGPCLVLGGEDYFVWLVHFLLAFPLFLDSKSISRPLPLNAFASGKVPTRDTNATTLALSEATLMLGLQGGYRGETPLLQAGYSDDFFLIGPSPMFYPLVMTNSLLLKMAQSK